MTGYRDAATRAGDQVLSTIGAAQDALVATVASVTERLAASLPQLPALPFASAIPSPAALVDQSFGAAARVLDAQKAYALDLAHALEPLSAKVVRNGASTARKASPTTTA